MPDITIGCILRAHKDDSEPVLYGRVVHMDKRLNLVVIAKFPGKDKRGHQKNYVPRPVISDLSAWEMRVQDGTFSVVDFDAPSHWLLTSDQLRSNASTGLLNFSRRNLKSWLRRRSEAYRLIRPFVHGRSIEDIVMDPALIGWSERRAEELNLKGCARIQRTLNAYILALGNRNGLLPWYSHCGNPGKPKFSKVKTGRPINARELAQGREEGMNCDQSTRVHFALGWKKFKLRGVSVRTAFNKTMATWFAKSVRGDGTSAKVTLQPEALKYNVKQFEYWGKCSTDALSAIAINKGETPARRTYLRRQGKAKDRHRTVNGEAFLDSTSCDQSLVSCASRLKVLSSPWRTDVQGAGTDYIFGHHVGFESPSQTTALMAILHAAEDKVEYCARFGINIQPRDWLTMTFRQFVMDNGEGKGQLAMSALEEMEAGASFGAAYDALNKSPQESKHASTQAHVDHLMPGSTMGRRKERGEPDRASMARLNFIEYMPLLIRHVLFHNNEEIITLPTLEMRRDGVEPTRRGVVEWMIANGYTTSAPTDLQALRIRCLPRLQACVLPTGIHLYDPTYNGKRIIPGLIFSSDWLRGSELVSQSRRRHLEAHLNPSDLSRIWVNLGGLKCMSLQSPDPDLKEVTLLDWLTISSDDRIRTFLDKANKVQEGVNAVAATNRSVKVANKERNAEIRALRVKPTKSELKRDKRTNTIVEKVAMTGVPVVPNDIAQTAASATYRDNQTTRTTKPSALHLDLAQAIRASRSK
ncbi:hypothetical protein [Aquabacterium sp.]|uniref:hypothetical protein n=1 Tax=Aquabacterium sp. TaxID=1872578 RepID=UPI0035B08907